MAWVTVARSFLYAADIAMKLIMSNHGYSHYLEMPKLGWMQKDKQVVDLRFQVQFLPIKVTQSTVEQN